jgi:hypothetical protein
MGDGAIVVVQPQSRLTVAEFRYDGKEDGTEKVRYKLEQGGFRAVTGAIGRTHKQNYLIETPIAHMGVRGTDHESYYFPATGPVGGDDAKPGAYNKVNTGRTFIRTGAGEVEIDPNQVGYVASAGEVPVILQGVPGFFNRSIAPRQARPAVNPNTPGTAQLAGVHQDVDTADGQLKNARLERTRGPRVAPGSGNGPLVGYSTAAGNARFGGSGNGVAVERNGAVEVAGSDVWGVSWWTWQGNVATVGGQATGAPTHFIDSSMKTAIADLSPALTTGTYTYAGGPGATTGAGAAATINSLNVGVNFSSQTITSYQLNASSATTSWTANLNPNGPNSFASFTGSAGIQLSGNCMGCTPGPVGTAAGGIAHGAFVGGAQAPGMITSFGLSAGGAGGNQSLSGAALLSKD